MRRLVVLVGLAVVATSCAQPSMTLDEYTAAATEATDAYVIESQNLSFDYQSGVEDGAREIVASGDDDAADQVLALARTETTQYLALLGDAMQRFHDALDALDPPDEVAAEHQAFVDAIDAVIASLPATLEGAEAAASLEDLQFALSASGLADGQFRWTATCSALEQAIRDEGQGVDLRCVRSAEAAPTP